MLLHHTRQGANGEIDALLAELDATNQAWQR
jgi:hypothetical protein